MGDFNSHNIMWNCRSTDINGDRLIEELERAGLYVVNDGTVTHIGDGGCQDSNIDLVLNRDDSSNFVRCRQLRDAWGSDHFLLVVDLGVKTSVYCKNVIAVHCIYGAVYW